MNRKNNVEIVVEGRRVTLFSDSDTDLRMNSVIYNPEEITSKQAEYSFTFELPRDRNNSEIFGYADNLSVRNKFSKSYDTVVYTDGCEVFKGRLRLSSIDDKSFKCNLLNYRINTTDVIFGESMMNELDWLVPFSGATTINQYNEVKGGEVYFPLACYGAFQKKPKTTYSNTFNDYTGLYEIDNGKYCKWYDESFVPSLHLNTLVRRLFESKGYTVQGDIFDDEIANNIYLSNYISSSQSPNYNLGNPIMGHTMIDFEWQNINPNGEWGYAGGLEGYGHSGFMTKDLQYKFEGVKSSRDGEGGYSYEYNLDRVRVYDIWASSDEFLLDKASDNGRLFRDNCIVVPADGLYKIDFSVEIDISGAVGQTAYKWFEGDRTGSSAVLKEVAIDKSWNNYPVEIQLVRNNDDGIELIKGSTDRYEIFPHESSGTTGVSVTVERSTQQGTNGTGTEREGGGNRYGSTTRSASNDRGTFGRGTDGGYNVNIQRTIPHAFIPADGEVLAYDAFVNDDFVCGASTNGRHPSVIKNGRSWSKEYNSKTNSRYTQEGYITLNRRWIPSESGRGGYYEYDEERGTQNRNVLEGSRVLSTERGFVKEIGVQCVVELKKNDILMLKAITRPYLQYDDIDSVTKDYYVHITGNVTFDAFAEDVRCAQNTALTWNYSPKPFSELLNLGGFLNMEEKQSDFINNYINAFNLSYESNGNLITLSKQKLDFADNMTYIDLDNRVSVKEAESSRIEYPKSIEVKYSIDDSESGFYQSVPQEHINDNDWKDWADVGSEPVGMSGDDEDEAEEISLKNSYCWYQMFNFDEWESFDDDEPSGGTNIMLPVIAKDEYFIDGSDYDEMMKHDGRSLKQRWWFRKYNGGEPFNPYPLTLATTGEIVYAGEPSNDYDGYVLDYRNGGGSILDRYFNIMPHCELNYVTVEAWITPEEYRLLKAGCGVKFDDDAYLVCEITGFDVSGVNKTQLKLLKKN